MRKGRNIKCKICKKEFYVKPSHLFFRKHCSKQCYHLSLLEKHLSPKTEFKKGMKISSEMRKKISEGHKGIPSGMLGKKHTQQAKDRIRNSQIGELSPHWRNGVSFEPYPISWNKQLKESIRERDNYTCKICKRWGNAVHHIDYNKKNCNPNNLITLCGSCNSSVNFNREYWEQYFLF